MFFPSCKNSNQNQPTAPKEMSKQDTSKDRGNNILPKIQPDRFWASYGSLWYIYHWEFDHYKNTSHREHLVNCSRFPRLYSHLSSW